MFVPGDKTLNLEAGSVPEKIIISHRGARYEIGRGKRYYGIWVTDAPKSDPIDRWPETPDGWAQAWARFITIEMPGTITRVEEPGFKLRMPKLRSPKTEGNGTDADTSTAGAGYAGRRLVAAGLLGLGVILGAAGLFPGYTGGQSLASQPDLLVPHLLYLVVWAVAAAGVLLGSGVVRGGAQNAPWLTSDAGARTGALLGIGLSAVTFGMFFSDLGSVIAGSSSGAGLVLSLLGWLACTAGAVLALTARGTKPRAAAAAPATPRPRTAAAGPLTLLVLAALGTAAAFAPSWDSYTLAAAATGATQTETAGNAFASPGPVIAGNVAVMVALVAVAVAAALWRPVKNGAVLLIGAIVPMIAQAISALIQVTEPTSPALFGMSQAQASAAGLTISAGVTPVFWVYCVFVISLIISCAWALTTPPHPAMPAPVWGPGGPIPPHHGTLGENSAVPGENDDEHSDGALDGRHDGDSEGKADGNEETSFA
jgi:hypothetical protein